jgi:hypothetical protein
MTYLNPLIGPVAQSPQAQRAASDKIARAQALAKNSAAEGDRFEHTVESADALPPVGDDAPNGGGGQRREKKGGKRKDGGDDAGDGGDGEPRLDLTA